MIGVWIYWRDVFRRRCSMRRLWHSQNPRLLRDIGLTREDLAELLARRARRLKGGLF